MAEAKDADWEEAEDAVLAIEDTADEAEDKAESIFVDDDAE